MAIQADMLAYRQPGEPMQLGLPVRLVSFLFLVVASLKWSCSITTPEVSQLVANISALYSPELVVGTTAVRPLSISD